MGKIIGQNNLSASTVLILEFQILRDSVVPNEDYWIQSQVLSSDMYGLRLII